MGVSFEQGHVGLTPHAATPGSSPLQHACMSFCNSPNTSTLACVQGTGLQDVWRQLACQFIPQLSQTNAAPCAPFGQPLLATMIHLTQRRRALLIRTTVSRCLFYLGYREHRKSGHFCSVHDERPSAPHDWLPWTELCTTPLALRSPVWALRALTAGCLEVIAGEI